LLYIDNAVPTSHVVASLFNWKYTVTHPQYLLKQHDAMHMDGRAVHQHNVYLLACAKNPTAPTRCCKRGMFPDDAIMMSKDCSCYSTEVRSNFILLKVILHQIRAKIF